MAHASERSTLPRWMTMMTVILLCGGLHASAVGAGNIIAVGSTYGETQPGAAEEDSPLILVGSRDAWHRVDAAGVVAGSLMGLSADPGGHAWAFGASIENPIVLQSSDDGASWKDLSAALALVAPDQIPVAMAFRTDLVGWVATRGRASGGPQLFRTDDGARTWTAVGDTGPTHASGTYALRVPPGDGDVVELAVSDPNGVSVRAISKDGPTKVESIAHASQMRAWVFAFREDTWWMFGREDGCSVRNESCVDQVGGEVQVDFPAIRRVDAKRVSLDRLIDSPTWTDLRAGHFFDPQTGVAGGEAVSAVRVPVLLRTSDGGTSWERGVLPESVTGGRIAAVVLTDAQVGWAAFNYVGRLGTMLLRTTDGGQHWTETSGGLAIGRLRALMASGN